MINNEVPSVASPTPEEQAIGEVVNHAVDTAASVDGTHALEEVSQSDLPTPGKLEAMKVLEGVTDLSSARVRAARRQVVIAASRNAFKDGLVSRYTLSAIRSYRATRTSKNSEDI